MSAEEAWQEYAATLYAPLPLRDGGHEQHAAFMAGYRRALEDAADAVKDIRENGLPPGVHSGPYAAHFETWLRDRAAAADPRETKD